MNGKTELIKSPVIYTIVSKRHIADRKVKEIFAVGSFKSCYGYICLWVELLRNSTAYAIQLHTIEATALHGIWQQTEKISDPHRRL